VSRIANRLYLELAHFEARDRMSFTRRAPHRLGGSPRTGTTLACDFSGRHPRLLNTHFGALKLKDGIVDALRSATGARPDVALERPGGGCTRTSGTAHQRRSTRR